jgi:hypothetical protein
MSPSSSRPAVERASRLLGIALLAATAGVATGCDPYDYLDDEGASLGAVDPANFPPANLGDGGNRMRPGLGSFAEGPALVAGQQVGYFSYPFPATLIPEMGPPVVRASTPVAIAFDSAFPMSVPAMNACDPPPGYTFDPRLEAFSRNRQQGNIFTALPAASYTPGVTAMSSYMPVVAEVSVSSLNHPCQQWKSRKAVEDAMGGMLPAKSNKYLAWLIIDPAAAVYPLEFVLASPAQQAMMAAANGISHQKWGWYNRYLLAYLDGGYIDTQKMGTPEVEVMVTQRLYIPRSPVMDGMDPVDAGLGTGFEVLTAKRGMPGYSPVCEVMTYDAGMPLAPDALPTDAAVITAMFGATLEPASPRFVFCLQVR